MTFRLVECPLRSKDTVFRKCWIFVEGPKLLFKYLFLTIIDHIYKTVSRILLLKKVSNLDYSEIVAGISYICFVLKGSKNIRPPNFFYLPFWPPPPSPGASMISHITTLANFWRPHFPL